MNPAETADARDPGSGHETVDGLEAVEKIARTCLYEGYLLWPYRRSALKNTKRWTFGGIYPECRAADLGEPSRMRTEVLLDTGAATERPQVSVRVRFLHILERQVYEHGPDGTEPVDRLTVADTLHLTWHEATEHEWLLPAWAPADGPCAIPVEVPAGQATEPLYDTEGRRPGSMRRSWQRLTATVKLDAVQVTESVLRIGVTIDNTTHPPDGSLAHGDRDTMASYALASTHTVLSTTSGAFLSLADPPESLRPAADACHNVGTWPVLVSGARQPDPQRARTVLSSPVTLYDFPAVAPESPGDLFDGGEIDQLLILSVLSLTPEEQHEARASDPRARDILDRCAALSPDDLMALHGTIRSSRPLLQEDA